MAGRPSIRSCQNVSISLRPWPHAACYTPQQGTYGGGYLQQASNCTPQRGPCVDCCSETSPYYETSNACFQLTLQVTGQDPPKCQRVKRKDSTNYLSSSDIEKTKLAAPETVIAKYRTLRVESKAGMLAVKLAKEAFLERVCWPGVLWVASVTFPLYPWKNLISWSRHCFISLRTIGLLPRSFKLSGNKQPSP